MVSPESKLPSADDDNRLLDVHRALQGLSFGSVEVTVHNGKIVQIERKEKFRLPPRGKQA